MARVQISIPDDTLKRVDAYAASASLSRSAFLSMAAADYINAKEKAPLIADAFEKMASLINSRVKGEISQEEFQSRINEIDASE